MVGGSESLMIDLVNEQSREHDVSLCIVNSPVDDGMLGRVSSRVRVTRIQRVPSSQTYGDFLRLYCRIALFRPAIIHCHHWGLGRTVRFYPCRKVLTLHDMTRDFGENGLRPYNRIFAISQAVADGIPGPTTGSTGPVVVHNGIHMDSVTQRSDYHFDTFRLVHVSRLVHAIKGQDLVLQALALLTRKHGISNIHVDFIGSGPSREYLEQQAATLGVSSYCTFLGGLTREEIWAGLRNYHALIQPSRCEGFGLTVVEGIAAKIPVIVSDIEGPMEVIGSGDYGYHFRSGDAEACAEAIRSVMETYGGEQEKLRLDAAYAHAKKNFDVRSSAAHYLDQYADVLDKQ